MMEENEYGLEDMSVCISEEECKMIKDNADLINASFTDSIWLSPGLNIIVGMAGAGKTRVCTAICAALTLGLDFGTNEKLEQKMALGAIPYYSTLYIQLEISRKEFIPIISAAYAGLNADIEDQRRDISIVNNSNTFPEDIRFQDLINRDEKLRIKARFADKLFYTITEAVKQKLEIKGKRIIMIDNLQALMLACGYETTSESDTRDILGRFRKFGEENGVCILLIHHGSKTDNTMKRGVASGSGSQAINNTANNVYVLGRTKKNPNLYYLEHTKFSKKQSETFFFEIEGTKKDSNGLDTAYRINKIDFTQDDEADKKQYDEGFIRKVILAFPQQQVTPTGLSRDFLRSEKKDCMKDLFEKELLRKGLVEISKTTNRGIFYILTESGKKKQEEYKNHN